MKIKNVWQIKYIASVLCQLINFLQEFHHLLLLFDIFDIFCLIFLCCLECGELDQLDHGAVLADVYKGK
jgi:hypothetical protein